MMSELLYTNEGNCLDISDGDSTAARLLETISDHSHDVRGRIASIRLRVHLLEKQAPADVQPLIAPLKEELALLTQMVSDLVSKSRPCDTP